ncbi:hypothetical protein EW145_g7521 [Phellinidium pouzarii]|uniref:Uncharacterized protein n=1 Tax=Phellinidium pouzarii TaxID=167371 RepID=A0A4V3XAF1_9AGAM|nr:hypothetical protein EW145_g7521 [Phellinidium pouzarii]
MSSTLSYFAHAGESAAVDLYDVNRPGLPLEQLLEDDAVMYVLSRRDANTKYRIQNTVPLRTAACRCTSSGSSISHGQISASDLASQSIAAATSYTWFASIMSMSTQRHAVPLLFL